MNMMKNIVLIGFMGTGKTSVGKLLAVKIGYAFVDTDAKIEEDNHLTIPEIFAQHGEFYFREREAEAVKAVAAEDNMVISTGGGVVLREENMAALRQSGCIVALTASADVIVERTSRNNDRPLLESENRRRAVEELMQQRAVLYAKADYMIDTGNMTPLQVVEEICDFVRRRGDFRA